MTIVLGTVPKICIRDKLDSRQNETRGEGPCNNHEMGLNPPFLISRIQNQKSLKIDKNQYIKAMFFTHLIFYQPFIRHFKLING